MKKKTVGIYAKYDASEQTLCASFLTGYIIKRYHYVKWFVPYAPTPGSRSWGFSHRWDTEVVQWTDNEKRLASDAKACNTCFFFEPNGRLLASLPPEATSIFVVNPRALSEDVYRFARKCKYILVTGSQWQEQLAFCDLLPGAINWPFDPSVQCIPRSNLDFEKTPRLFFPTFGFSYAERNFVEQVIEIVRCCKPNIQSVIGFYDAKTEPRPGYDSRTYDWRLLKYLQNSDWIIDLNPKPLYCLFAACAGGHGLQWFGFETSPNTDYYNSARRHLIKTEVRSAGPRQVVRALPDLNSTAEQLVRRLDTPFNDWLDRNTGCGAWDNRRAEFFRVTNMVLGIKTRY